MEHINIAIVDDHQLILRALENLVSGNKKYKVILNARNGSEFLETLKNAKMQPDVVLMDINMPIKNGIETTKEISSLYPDVKVIALTMEDNEKTIIDMLKAGAKGYLLKDMAPEILYKAIDIVSNNGTFYTDIVTQSVLRMKAEEAEVHDMLGSLKDTEVEFMKLACSELTYKEIADKMCLSPRTIDGYRDSIFAKLNVKSRVGIVLFVLKNNMLHV